MNKVKDNIAEIIVIILAIIMMSSCKREMPPVHKLYYELSVEEKQIYNSFNAEERVNINKNTEMHQLKNALGDEFYRLNTNKVR